MTSVGKWMASGKAGGMAATIDAAGRIVVPKSFATRWA